MITSSPTMPFPSFPVCGPPVGRRTLLYPARYLFQFLDHHGLLRLTGSPRWYSVIGGSRSYVDRVAALLPDVRAAHAVLDITRREDGVEIRDVTGQITRVDRVVIATHADQALALLCDPSDAEVTTLKEFGYSAMSRHCTPTTRPCRGHAKPVRRGTTRWRPAAARTGAPW